jgi:hypothetical protein
MPAYHITAVGIYEHFIVLNPMMGNTEQGTQFGPFPSREAALVFYNGEKVEPYKEEGHDSFGNGTKMYSKSFRKGGPLEWYNPLHETELITPGCFGHGIHEVLVRVEQAVKGQLLY